MLNNLVEIFNQDFWNLFLELWFVFMGLILFATAISSYQSIDDKRKYGAASFWTILSILFIFGKWIPSVVAGVLVIVLGILSALKVVNIGQIAVIPQEFRNQQSDRIGLKIFVPSMIIALGTFVIAFILPKLFPTVDAAVLGNVSVGIAAAIGLIVTLVITKSSFQGAISDATRLVRAMGSYSILPQLLTALGTVFTAAGVGTLISTLLNEIIPENSVLVGVIAYCVGMALFTIIMGNAFAAFTVITVGVGVPFVFAQGGNPVIAGALAMTAGFCGTLMTPMAANFNIIPATLLETKSEYSVIKYQLPFAIVLLVIHIVLMYWLAF